MGSGELSLVGSVESEGLSDLLIHLKFIRDLKLNEELGSVSDSLQVLRSEEDPEENVLNSSLISILNFSLGVMHESKDL
jgi:hypothetical protein